MRRHVKLPVMAIAGVLSCFTTTGYAQASFTLTINAPQDTFKVGVDVPVSVTLTNISDQVLEVTTHGYLPSILFRTSPDLGK